MEMFQYWLVGLQAAAVNKDLFLDDLLGLSEGFKKKARLSSVRCGAGLMLTRQDAHCARSVAEGKKKPTTLLLACERLAEWCSRACDRQYSTADRVSECGVLFEVTLCEQLHCFCHEVSLVLLVDSSLIGVTLYLPYVFSCVDLCTTLHKKKKKLTLNALLLYKSVRSDYLFLFSCIYEWIIYLFWIKMDNCWL